MIFRLLSFALIAGWVMSAPAAAQTVGYASAIGIFSKTCGKDVVRFCGKIPMENVPACLDTNAAKISPTCKAARSELRSQLEIRAKAQAGAEKTCQRDINHFCKTMKKGKGHLLRCLLTAEKRISKQCNKILADAGYK